MATSIIPAPSASPMSTDPAALRSAFAAFPSGVVAVAGLGSNGPVGLAASSYTSVSLDPPLVSVCIAKTSQTWRSLHPLARLGVSVLADGQGGLCRTLASKVVEDRFAETAWSASTEGAVFINDAALWLDCSIEATLDAGDHEIVLLRIETLTRFVDVEPLVFHDSKFTQLAVVEAQRDDRLSPIHAEWPPHWGFDSSSFLR